MGDFSVKLVNFMIRSLLIVHLTFILLLLQLLLIRDVHNTSSVIHLIFLVETILGSRRGLWSHQILLFGAFLLLHFGYYSGLLFGGI